MLSITSIHRCGLIYRPHLLCIFFGEVQERQYIVFKVILLYTECNNFLYGQSYNSLKKLPAQVMGGIHALAVQHAISGYFCIPAFKLELALLWKSCSICHRIFRRLLLDRKANANHRATSNANPCSYGDPNNAI